MNWDDKRIYLIVQGGCDSLLTGSPCFSKSGKWCGQREVQPLDASAGHAITDFQSEQIWSMSFRRTAKALLFCGGAMIPMSSSCKNRSRNYSDREAIWKDADPDIPILKQREPVSNSFFWTGSCADTMLSASAAPSRRRLLQTNRENQKWLVRMMLILLLVGLAEVLVVLFVPKPLLWVVLIPVLIPLLTSFLIIFPMSKAEKPAPPGRS
jgi:hypothetical protein